jgi:hypothetical protein
VIQPTPIIASAASAKFTLGQASSFTVKATGYGPTYVGLSLAAPTSFTATSVTGSKVVTVSGGTTANLVVGAALTGPGLASGTTIATILSPTTLLLSVAAKTGAVKGAFTETSVPSLPAGITFTDNGNGTASFSGIPQAGATGAYTFTILATLGSNTVTRHFTLTIAEAPAIISADLANFVVGSNPANKFTIQALGYPAAVFSVIGVLPAGLKLVTNPGGTATLSGAPLPLSKGKTSVTFTFLIAASAAGSPTKSYQSFSVIVS